MNPKTKREITGLEPGSELGWTDLGWTASARATGLDQFRFLVFKDPNWDHRSSSTSTPTSSAPRRLDNDTINALDPNLKPFFDRGGKLIQYHGWSDPQISPGNSVQYYKRVLETNWRRGEGRTARIGCSWRPAWGTAAAAKDRTRSTWSRALEQWVEQGKAPDRIVASHSTDGKVDRTRPLCPYPQVATYKGTGSTDDAANFVCK